LSGYGAPAGNQTVEETPPSAGCGPGTDTLAAEIGRTLLADQPDVRALSRRLQSSHGLSREEADPLIYRVAAELNSRFFPPLTKLELILTEGCNLACSYCFEKPMRKLRRMPSAVARAAIDLLLEYSADVELLDVTHFGGEPLLNLATLAVATEYAEQRAAAAGKKIGFSVTTNGVLLNQEVAEYLARHGIKVLLSIDGAAQSHDRYRLDRQGRGTFVQVMAALRLLKTQQPWVGAKMTVMPENAPRLFDDVRYLYDQGVNQFLIGYATGVTWGPRDLDVYKGEIARLHHWYSQGQRNDLRIAEFEAGPGPVPRFGCQAGRDSISISATGEVSCCSKVLALNNERLLCKLGDVRYGLSHLHNRAQLAGCRRLRSECEVLGIASDYTGGCFATNYEENGDLFRPSLQDHTFSLAKREILHSEIKPQPTHCTIAEKESYDGKRVLTS
jgi:uncharacterized protein